MKKLLFLCSMLWASVASAQFTPGQILTAAELNSTFALYAPLAGAAFTGNVAVAGTVSGPGFTNLLAPYLLSTTAASTYATIPNLALKAPLASPAFTGTPTAPTAANGTGTTQLATTAYVITELGSPTLGIGSVAPAAGAFTNLSASGTVSGAGFTSLLSGFAPLSTVGNIAGLTFLGTSSTLTLGELGQAIQWFGTSPGTFTLPSAATIPSSGIYRIFNQGTGALTISVAGGSDFIYDGVNHTSITIAQFESVTLVGRGTTEVDVMDGGYFSHKGVTNGSAAVTGQAGELVSTAPVGPITITTSGTAQNITSLVLQPGDWDVWATLGVQNSTTTALVLWEAGVSTTTATLPGPMTGAYIQTYSVSTTPVSQAVFNTSGVMTLSNSSATTVFCVQSVFFTGLAPSGFCRIFARRIR